MTTAASHDTKNVAETDLISCVPHLRAWFLTKNRERADELVQDTIVQALTEAHPLQPGTNLKAVMFTILRRLPCNEPRTSQIRIQSLDDPLSYEPAVLPSQVASLEFGDFRRAFWQLGDDLREVLILVGASGLSYQDAATVCGCRKGTMMSSDVARASRAAAGSGRRLAGRQAARPTLVGWLHRLPASRPARKFPSVSTWHAGRLSPSFHGALTDCPGIDD